MISFKGSINVRLVHLYNKDYSLHEDTIKKENLNSTGSECILDFDKMKSDGIFHLKSNLNQNLLLFMILDI